MSAAEVTKSVMVRMAEGRGMDPAKFEQTLMATVIPGGKATREQVAAVLLVAEKHGLDVFTKELYAFPSQGGVVPVVGVDGWARIINGHAAFDGMEFEDHVDDEGRLAAITCRIHRKDRGHPVEVTEYMVECKRNTGPWQSHPRRMLRHKAMIQAARLAFSFSGIHDPDEAERIVEAGAREVVVQESAKDAEELANRLEAEVAVDEPEDDPFAGTVEGPQGEGLYEETTA